MPTRARGRPAKRPDERKRNNVTIRLIDDLKERVEAAASASGRSLSEEIAARLEQSFQQRNAVVDALGGERRYALFRLLAAAAETIELHTGKSQFEDWTTGAAVLRAWTDLAQRVRPMMPEYWIDAFTDLPEVPQPAPHPKSGGKGLEDLSWLDELTEAEKREYAQEFERLQPEMDRYQEIVDKKQASIAQFRKDRQAIEALARRAMQSVLKSPQPSKKIKRSDRA